MLYSFQERLTVNTIIKSCSDFYLCEEAKEVQ